MKCLRCGAYVQHSSVCLECLPCPRCKGKPGGCLDCDFHGTRAGCFIMKQAEEEAMTHMDEALKEETKEVEF